MNSIDWRRNSLLSSNGKEVKEGNVVLYSLGSYMVKCVVRKITWTGRGPEESSDGRDHRRAKKFHLELVEKYNRESRDIGHKFTANSAERLWVLPETMDDILASMFIRN